MNKNKIINLPLKKINIPTKENGKIDTNAVLLTMATGIIGSNTKINVGSTYDFGYDWGIE